MSKSEIGALQLFCIGFGLVIGVGWVFMPGIWIADAGWAGATIAFVIGGLCTGYLALVYQEISPGDGRRYNEIEIANSITGPLTALLMGAGLLLFYVSGLVFEALAIIWLIDSFYPSVWSAVYQKTELQFDTTSAYVTLLLVTSTAILIVNLRGLRTSSLWQVALVTALGSGILLSIILALAVGDVRNLGLTETIADPAEALSGIGNLVPTVFMWFVGFNVVLDAGRASSLSKKKVATITLLVILAGGCVHLVSIAIGGLLAPRDAYLMADAAPGLLGAFERVASGSALKAFVFAAAMAGLFSTANGFFVAVYRMIAELTLRHGQRDFSIDDSQEESPSSRALFITYGVWIGLGLMVVAGPDIEQTIRIILDAASISIIAVYFGILVICMYNRFVIGQGSGTYRAPFLPVVGPILAAILIMVMAVLVLRSAAPSLGFVRLDLLLFSVAALAAMILHRVRMVGVREE